MDAPLHGITLPWATFALGALFGVAARASGFCLLRGLRSLHGLQRQRAQPGATADDARTAALPAFALALAVALAGTQALVFSGALQGAALLPARASFAWPATLLGGALFGAGMALANGCGARALVLLAGGNLRCLLTLLCMALGAQATLTGVLAPLAQWLRQWGNASPAHPSLSAHAQALGLNALAGWALLGALPAAALAAWALSHAALRRQRLQWLGASAIGALVAAGWWIGHALADPFDERAVSSLSFVGPVADGLLYLQLAVGRQPGTGTALVAGTLLGAAITAQAMRTARWQGFERPRQMAVSAAGGLLMGLGGVLAVGCSIGQGISGLSTLAWASLPAAAGIAGGALATIGLQRHLFPHHN